MSCIIWLFSTNVSAKAVRLHFEEISLSLVGGFGERTLPNKFVSVLQMSGTIYGAIDTALKIFIQAGTARSPLVSVSNIHSFPMLELR